MRFAAFVIVACCLAGCLMGCGTSTRRLAIPQEEPGSAAPAPSAPSTPAATQSATTEPTTEATTEPTTEPTTNPTTRAATTQPGPAGYVLPEGTMVIDRTGRFTRTPKGDPEFALDPDGKGLKDSPMFLLRNLELEQMEDAAAADPRVKFKVTGIITGYDAHDYLLLTKVEIAREAGTE
jgi:hypothetical protein